MTSGNAEARLAGLLDSAMDAIISVDESQRVVLYNRAAERIFGWPAADIIGQPLVRLIPERFRQNHDDHVRRFGETGVTTRRMSGSTVVYGVRRGGEEFPVDASISQVETPEGRLFTVILRDITERVRSQQALSAFAAEASGVREQEKSRIARELHDELAQTLTALKIDVGWLQDNLGPLPKAAQERLAAVMSMLDTAVASTRRIASDLRPLVLDDLGLVPAIEWLAQSFTRRTGVACRLDAPEEIELGEPHATAVFRIVQESLNNVAKHAQARRVEVRLQRAGDRIEVSVQDDGAGFLVTAERKPQSLGLAGLRERAHLVRGELRVHSEPGEGTRIEAVIPVPADRADDTCPA